MDVSKFEKVKILFNRHDLTNQNLIKMSIIKLDQEIKELEEEIKN